MLAHLCAPDCAAPGAPALVCLAESRDAIAWAKPKLGLYNFSGSTDNNILIGAEGCSVFLDPVRPGVPESEHWKMVCSNGEGTRGPTTAPQRGAEHERQGPFQRTDRHPYLFDGELLEENGGVVSDTDSRLGFSC